MRAILYHETILYYSILIIYWCPKEFLRCAQSPKAEDSLVPWAAGGAGRAYLCAQASELFAFSDSASVVSCSSSWSGAQGRLPPRGCPRVPLPSAQGAGKDLLPSFVSPPGGGGQRGRQSPAGAGTGAGRRERREKWGDGAQGEGKG